MSMDFKRLILWMVLVAILVVFVGVNTFFVMYEQVDTFERQRRLYVSLAIEEEPCSEFC